MTPPDTTVDRLIPVADARPNDVAWPAMSWPPPTNVRLSGRVVDVSPLVPERDADALFHALNHDQVWQHVADRPQNAAAYTVTMQNRIAAGALPWVVRLRTSYAGFPPATVVGTSSYCDISVADARLEIGTTAHMPDLWGTAVNPDIKLELLSYAFEELKVGRVQLKTDVRNIRSQRAIARLGASYEGTLRRYQRRADGTIRDTVLFSVLADEWPAVRAGLTRRLDTVLANGSSR